MELEILGTESLGVRGLCCVVKTRHREIVIDPGVALGYQRAGLLPHPIQVAVGEDVRCKIVRSLKSATDIVISHFHGDHMPLSEANPYQLSLLNISDLFQKPKLWIKGVSGENDRIAKRRCQLFDVIARSVPSCQNQTHGPLVFSDFMPHGLDLQTIGTVMMMRVKDGTDVFVHASDIQLLADEPVSQILDWSPTIVLLSGPPLYRNLPVNELEKARIRAKTLADVAEVCIIDHHLLRCLEGAQWLDELARETNGKIMCAADFMKTQRCLLEARRSEMYEHFPVPQDWHEAYARGRETTARFRQSHFQAGFGHSSL